MEYCVKRLFTKMYKNSRARVLLENIPSVGLASELSVRKKCQHILLAGTLDNIGDRLGCPYTTLFHSYFIQIDASEPTACKPDREQFSALTMRWLQVVMAAKWSDNPILVGQSCFVTQHYLNNVTETKRALNVKHVALFDKTLDPH